MRACVRAHVHKYSILYPFLLFLRVWLFVVFREGYWNGEELAFSHSPRGATYCRGTLGGQAPFLLHLLLRSVTRGETTGFRSACLCVRDVHFLFEWNQSSPWTPIDVCFRIKDELPMLVPGLSSLFRMNYLCFLFENYCGLIIKKIKKNDTHHIRFDLNTEVIHLNFEAFSSNLRNVLSTHPHIFISSTN